MASGSINERIDVAREVGISRRDLDDRGLGEVGEVLQEIVYLWRAELQRTWPRATGLSFASWESFVRGVEIVLRNPVDYAAYVHPIGEQPGGSWRHMDQYVQQLIRDDAATLRRIAADSAQRIEAERTARAMVPTQEAGIAVFGALAAAFSLVGGQERQEQFFGAQALRSAVASFRQSEPARGFGDTLPASRARSRNRPRTR